MMEYYQSRGSVGTKGQESLWYNEETAAEYVRLHASVRVTPNMATIDFFCKWVNKSLLPNSLEGLRPSTELDEASCQVT